MVEFLNMSFSNNRKFNHSFLFFYCQIKNATCTFTILSCIISTSKMFNGLRNVEMIECNYHGACEKHLNLTTVTNIIYLVRIFQFFALLTSQLQRKNCDELAIFFEYIEMSTSPCRDEDGAQVCNRMDNFTEAAQRRERLRDCSGCA